MGHDRSLWVNFSNGAIILAAWAIAATVLMGAKTAHAQDISTLPQWNGSAYEEPYGIPNTTTYGQTITLTSPEYINNFTFEIQGTSGANIFATPYVYAWNGTSAIGSPLFTGSDVNIFASAGFVPVTVNTGETLLNPGQYVLLFTSSGTAEYDASTGTSNWGLVEGSDYAGGDFVYLNNGADFTALTSASWASNPNNYYGFTGQAGFDAAFSATLSSVPEPTSFSLLAIGAAGLLRRRRVSASR